MPELFKFLEHFLLVSDTAENLKLVSKGYFLFKGYGCDTSVRCYFAWKLVGFFHKSNRGVTPGGCLGQNMAKKIEIVKVLNVVLKLK